MKLNEFINELKHKSLHIDLFDGGKFLFTDNVSVLIHWVHYPKYMNYRVVKIEPLVNSLNIFIESEGI